MGAPIDLAGQRFGRLVAVRPTRSSRGLRAWECRCDCGTSVHVVETANLRYGHSRSCGCLATENRHAARLTHGGSRRTSDGGRQYHPLFRLWWGMVDRCRNAEQYAGRGIRVCERWLHDFATFADDMGPRPSLKHSLDRIDNDGDYEPGNVRWATAREQNRNRRVNITITIGGLTRVAGDWARANGIDPFTAYRRIRHGWDPVKAVTEPPVAPSVSARWAGKGSPHLAARVEREAQKARI